ncbi:hypothetical protein CCACVL1_28974 [Corchorus capsularis]|uniref:Uncharacterized protein n=1 Tax=Corchorus capsularis TaxID=210143 RepID=A0A1R3G4D9_COCAP|nr:hypothetical protein CCACVL1_28974 [Corchorus capsularis]
MADCFVIFMEGHTNGREKWKMKIKIKEMKRD